MSQSSKPPTRSRMKTRAPPPPQAPQPTPRHILRTTIPDSGGTSGMDTKENILKPTVDFKLTLPQGYQTSVTEDGSKALMDLLIELCSQHHLNPALYTLELLSPEGHTLGFKPNALLGSMNVACVLIKERVWEEKSVRRPVPKVPEKARLVTSVRAHAKKTVRLMVNYHSSQKAVVRVNPLVPLRSLIPVICNKCEFDPAHVLLLKDGTSHRELPLDKTLTELEIKELYVHNQGLVLQPRMSSAPALNYSDSIHSSTSSLSRTEKKGFLGIFQFSKKKNKRETTSMGMDDYDDKAFQKTDVHSEAMSTSSGISSKEYRPSIMAQSQSLMNLPRMSPKGEAKKRRAPALPVATPTTDHTSFDCDQTGLSSESQQRKRKAPAPPPNPAPITPGPDNTTASATPTPNRHATEIPSPVSHAKVAQTTTISATSVVTQTVKPVPLKTAEQPQPACTATQTPSSPNPSNSTTDSLAVNDSSSELSHSIDDSDTDLDQTSSQCSSLASSTVSGSLQVPPTTLSSNRKMEEPEKPSNIAANLNQEATSASCSSSETELAQNLKMDEAENNRDSTMGALDRPAPPKPRRSPARDSPQSILPPTSSSLSIEPRESSQQGSMESEEAAPLSLLNSIRRSVTSGQKPETETLEEETMSFRSSSSGSSLLDQGYAASEGMGEDLCMVISLSDTQPTSPDGSFPQKKKNRSRDGDSLPRPVRDNSSDSDEGCATWGSKHRNSDFSQRRKSSGVQASYEDDPELTAQIRQTLADFEAELADHIDVISVKETPLTRSTDNNMVPVTVVDLDVPVTAIDEVLDDYECKMAKSLTRPESAGCKGSGSYHQSSLEPRNKNNNACTADIDKSNMTNTKQPPQPEQQRRSLEHRSKRDKKEENVETKTKATITDTNSVKKNKQRASSASKSNFDQNKHSQSPEEKPNLVESKTQFSPENKPVLPTTSQRRESVERNEGKHSSHQNNSSLNTYGKISHNVTSRFGLKTFTVIPPKPAVSHVEAGSQAVTSTLGAIKIDNQGNMVRIGILHSKCDGSSASEADQSEVSPLIGKAKSFWSSNERQESVPPFSKYVIDNTKEKIDDIKSTPTITAESTTKNPKIEDLKSMQTYEKAQLKKMVEAEAKESVEGLRVATEQSMEVKSKISVSAQEPSKKICIPPTDIPNQRKDLSFLKPNRRTSSQYVASAISKYTSHTSAKPNFFPNVPDSSAPPLRNTIGFQRSGWSSQVNPQQSPHINLSDKKEIDSALKSNRPASKRSMSHPENVSESQADFVQERPERGGFGSRVRSIRGSINTVETEENKTKSHNHSGLTKINLDANTEDRDNIKPIWQSCPAPAQSSSIHLCAEPPKTTSQGQTKNTKDVNEDANCPTPNGKPHPSVIVLDSSETSGSQPVTVFGPLKKFRPVIHRSVEKEKSLHSSLMNAIHTGGGRGRLKKINNCSPGSMNKTSYVEEENERSALLTAIRAQSNSGLLKKTKCQAAVELEKLRRASEEERSADPPCSPVPLSSTCTSPVFAPPPPPSAPMIAPPTPPPVLPQVKPSTVANPSVNTPRDTAFAREAMLDAIRSGSAGERLKKVAVPTKTVKVNGRLGTIQAASSTLPQQ